MNLFIKTWLSLGLILFFGVMQSQDSKTSTLYGASLTIENDHFRITIDEQTGAITSLFVKANQSELIEEKQLVSNFRICLPLEDYQANYIEGMDQKSTEVTQEGNSITAKFSGMSSPQGEFPVDLSYSVTLVDDYVSFRSSLTNHHSEPISEFWFPRIGGWKKFGDHREAKLATPKFNSDSEHSVSLFRHYPGGRGLGAEAAEWVQDYPPVVTASMVMPWWDIYDQESDIGLYLGYHDPIFRVSSWHTYLMPNHSGQRDAWLKTEHAGGQPVGLVFSHVRYPFIQAGETLESGEFIIRAHQGDWHQGSQLYRDWFMENFPFDKSNSWLRKKSAWFTSIIYQPEDKIIADYKLYDQWTIDAQKYGIDCFELIGWDSGGLERDYPIYQPEAKLGGRKGFRQLMRSIDSRGGKCLVFNNYNFLDQNTEWYKSELHKFRQHDGFGQNISLGWGESTLLARKGMNVRHHVRSTITPEFEEIIADQFIDLVRDGAHGFQIDKVGAGGVVDFNPLNTLKPDVALFEGLVQAIDRLNQKCLAINPDFRMASEFNYDRLIPYFDIGYRNAHGLEISAFRYVFPEWTSCIHVSAPRDFRSINGAVLTGSVICIEPDSYQGSLDQPIYHDLAKYIQEVERIRKDLLDIIFLGKYYDNLDATVLEVVNEKRLENTVQKRVRIAQPGEMPGMGNDETSNLKKSTLIHYRVHGHQKTDQRAIVVVNDSPLPVNYIWEFTHESTQKATLYEPFKEAKIINQGDPVEIHSDGLHILVEEKD